MNNQVVIQLNAGALEKVIELCGGDEFILHLKRATIENVLRGRSKALVNNVLEEAMKAQIAYEVGNTVGEVKNIGWGNKTITLQPEFLSQVQMEARVAVGKAMDALKVTIPGQVDEMVKSYAENIQKHINDLVRFSFKKEVDAEVKRRIEEALKG